ncbi:MAG: type IV pilus twitching motility protein PilT [Fimbriimonadaceae bacterium]|nr:type IV pilus twitching motility protein PilT [Fimbriimonadaceae bacterium]
MQSINHFLELCVRLGGSDVHFKTDTGRVYLRINGELQPVDAQGFSDAEFRSELYKILQTSQIAKFENDLELDFAIEVPELSRFRGNCYQQRGHMQAAFRVIPYEIQTMADLQLPSACYDFVQRPRGLVLVTGPAGSGKSTSLASMLDHINRTQKVHIMTVEDPVEFVHDDRLALINQRELEVDTLTFANALKYVLRQDPDVILVGEMRDLDTIHLAITAAETGHLVFGTLHTVDAVQTVDRIVDVFPMHQQQQIRMQLSVNLVGVMSQTLVRRADGRGRVAAHEVLVASSAVRNLIRENKSYQINSLIQTGARQKMITLDQSLANLVERGIVDASAARARAKDPNEFDRLLALGQQATGTNGGSPAPARPTAPPSTGVRGQPNRPSFRRE